MTWMHELFFCVTMKACQSVSCPLSFLHPVSWWNQRKPPPNLFSYLAISMFYCPIKQKCAAGWRITQRNQMKRRRCRPQLQKSFSCFRLSTASRILRYTRLQMFHHSCKRNMATGTKSFKRAILNLIHGYFVIAVQTWLKRLHSLTTSGSHMVLHTCRLKWWNKPLENNGTKRRFFWPNWNTGTKVPIGQIF